MRQSTKIKKKLQWRFIVSILFLTYLASTYVMIMRPSTTKITTTFNTQQTTPFLSSFTTYYYKPNTATNHPTTIDSKKESASTNNGNRKKSSMPFVLSSSTTTAGSTKNNDTSISTTTTNTDHDITATTTIDSNKNRSSTNSDNNMTIINNNVTHLSYHHHSQIVPLQQNFTDSTKARFAQLKAGPMHPDFADDADTVRNQLRSNYHPHSSCPSVTLDADLKGRVLHFPPQYCYGLGSTILFFNALLANLTVQSSTVVRDMDTMSCGWFQRDTTRSCTTMFGNCYLQSLSSISSSETDNNNNINSAHSTCYSVSWFVQKWGMEAYVSVHLTWLLRVYQQQEEEPSNKNNQQHSAIISPQEESSPAVPTTTASNPKNKHKNKCIALHIRRGDTCHIRHLRACVAYQDYYQALQIVLENNPEYADQNLVVLTDAPDFPLEEFQELIPNIILSNTADKTKYTFEAKYLRSLHKDKSQGSQPRRQLFPENRNLGNATSEFLQEWQLAQNMNCDAVIGTFSSSISCLLFQNMMGRYGRVPIFISLQSCLHQVNELQVTNAGCESPGFLVERNEFRILPVS